MTNKNLSGEAQWFLNSVQNIQDDFTKAVGAQIVVTNQEGNTITGMCGAQRVCQLIQATKKGKEKCGEAYQTALSLVKKMKEPAFMDCYAGYASLWVPIRAKGEIVGSITGCGGRYDRGENRKELTAKYSKLANDLKIANKEDFLKAAVDEISPIAAEEMKIRAERLAKLVGILAEETALDEVFGTKK